MKKVVFFALVSVLLLNLAIASHGKALKQSDLPNLEPKLQRVIAKAGIKQLLAEDIVQSGKMEGQILPKLRGFGHTALDLFSDNEVCMTVDFTFGEQQGVLSLLFRWIGLKPILVDWSHWLVNTEVSDDISEDTHWTPEESPYYVTGGVSIHGGVTLTIEPGTLVRFRKFTDPQRIELWVSGDGGKLLSQGTDANPVIFTSNCDFEDLDEIQGMGWESSDWGGIRTDWNDNITVMHTTLEYAASAVGTWEREGQIIVSDSMLRKCAYGVETNGWSSVTVTNNIISDCGNTAIYVEFWEPDAGGDIIGNMITTHPDSWSWGGICINGGIPNISGNVITGNNFDCGIRAEWLKPSAVIMENTINSLDWANNGIWVGEIAEGDCTISGNEVTGSFDVGIGLESIFNGMVTSNTITSSDSSWTGIAAWSGDCTISENEITGSFEHGIMLESFNGVVSSNTIISPPSSSWACIAAWHGEMEISDNYIEGYFDTGIFVENLGPDGLVNGNTIIGQREDEPLPIAINIDGGEPTVETNIISGVFDQAIIAVAGSNATISGNEVTGSFWVGITANEGEPTISSNTIEGYFSRGIWTEHVGSGAQVIGNMIIGAVDEILPVAIQITGGEPTVDANIIPVGAFDHVIHVEDGSTAKITNHCSLTGNYGVYCENSAPQIHFNNIEGNAECGVHNETPDTQVDATENWWGDVSGPFHPDLNPTGQGNCVSDGVIFDPWLLEPVCVD